MLPTPDISTSTTDLTLTRVIDAPPSSVWIAWTTAEHLKRWFAPLPYTTPMCTLDVRPGGTFRTVMRAPDGNEFDTAGVFLEVVEQRRLVFTDALDPDFRPSKAPFFTASITLEPRDGGTLYTVVAMHKDEQDRIKHEEMGFFDGWGRCIEQLTAVARELAH